MARRRQGDDFICENVSKRESRFTMKTEEAFSLVKKLMGLGWKFSFDPDKRGFTLGVNPTYALIAEAVRRGLTVKMAKGKTT